MKGIILLMLVAMVTAAPNPVWEAWKQLHEKKYSNEEETVRRSIWEKNLQTVELHNIEHEMGKHTYTMGMNKYSDLEHHEFVEVMCGFRNANKTRSSITYLSLSNVQVPDTVDWRDQGYVTEVKDQEERDTPETIIPQGR
ncbi:cathepsin S-like [Saccoglossus kowalevskii]|uniref:Cathepsin S-like n=1 Tax=Saccoglossus kowalevskii TaxID=10224 RepID=A0ABM0MX44_SACKO|nr:PREDICTED: cathepsin S-like [Saccoglossus kowalevskii]